MSRFAWPRVAGLAVAAPRRRLLGSGLLGSVREVDGQLYTISATPLPDGGVAELLRFIQELSEFKPSAIQEDIEHRSKFRPALQKAAEKILKLDKDPASEARQAAAFVLLANRVSWIAQAAPQEQRRTIADVQAYLAEKAEKGQAGPAADLAMSLAQTLERMGEPAEAVDAYIRFADSLSKGAGEDLSQWVGRMKAGADRSAKAHQQSRLKRRKLDLPPRGNLVPLDIQSKVNQKLVFTTEGQYAGNGLTELPRGEHAFGGVKFKIVDGLIQLAGTQLTDMPAKAEGIPVDRRIARLYVLQATQWGSPDNVKDGTVVGQYKIHYEDGSEASMPIVFGQDVRDWWNWDQGRPVTQGKVVWTGSSAPADENRVALRLYLGVWDNPRPQMKVACVDFISTNDTICAPFCVAMTVEEPAAKK